MALLVELEYVLLSVFDNLVLSKLPGTVSEQEEELEKEPEEEPDETVAEEATCKPGLDAELAKAIKCVAEEHRPVWVCGAWFILGQYGIDFETSGPRLNSETSTAGVTTTRTHPWEVAFTTYDTKPPKKSGIKYPFISDFGKTDTISKYGVSITSLNVHTGEITMSPDAQPATGKMYSALKSNRVPVDARYAVPFSSSFLNMGSGMYYPAKKAQCGVGLPGPTAVVREIYNLGFGIEVKGKGTPHNAMTSDGGDTDCQGVIPLLRKQAKSVIMVFDGPYNIVSKYQLLFGDWQPFTKACSGRQQANGRQQVFPKEYWERVQTAIQSHENTGVHFYENVPVKQNDLFGVASYTLDNLVIVDNTNKTMFEQEVFSDVQDTIAKLSTDAVTEDNAAAPYPCDGTAAPGKNSSSGCKKAVKAPVANANSLLYQWKIKKNADKLKAIFFPDTASR